MKTQALESLVLLRDKKIQDLEKCLNDVRYEISERSEHFVKTVEKKDNKMQAYRESHEKCTESTNIVMISLKKETREKANRSLTLSDQATQAEQQVYNKFTQVEDEYAAQTSNVTCFLSETERLEQKVKQLDKIVNYKSVENTELNNSIELLEKSLKDKNDMVCELQKKEQDLKNTVWHRDSRIKDFEKHLEDVSAQLRENEERLAEIVKENDTQLRNLVSQIQSAQRDSNKNEAIFNKNIDKLKTEILEKDNRISEQRDVMTKANQAITNNEDIINSLNTRLQLLEKEIDKRGQRIRHLEELSVYQGEKEAKAKEKYDLLNEENSSLQQKIKFLQRDIEQRNRKMNDLETTLHRTREDDGGYNEKKNVKKKEQELLKLKEQLQHTLRKLRDTETELDETKTRLSKSMGAKLTDNNPNITDLSDRNRPTKLAERYAELYDNQWTDAFDILDEHFQKEEKVIEVLLLILQDAMTFCITKAREQMEQLGWNLIYADKQDIWDVSANVQKLLKDCRKASADVSVGNLNKMYVSQLKLSTDQILRRALEVSSYTTACLHMCWLMVIQDPPVVFAPLAGKGSSFNTDLYKPYTKSGPHIEFVVWPPLLLHEGGPMLAKGVAQGYSKKST